MSLATRHSPFVNPRRRRGFALLITITLVAFLVLILVSLATLTRVETQVAANSRQQDQARQHALLALNIAVGQLQKYAGPDQRITARSDINPDVFVDPADLTQGLDPAKNSRWTGVYGSRVPADYAHDPKTIADNIETAYTSASSDPLAAKGSQAILLNWLVSGSESLAGFDPATDVRADGSINLATTPVTAYPARLKPTATTLATTSVTPTRSDEHALLVGGASVSAATDRVSAPLVDIDVSESTLPGFNSAGTASLTIGRYAWWVGDENAKAHVNLSPRDDQAPLAYKNPKDAFIIAQRSAVELVDAVNPSDTVVPFDPDDLIGYTPAAYDPTQTSVNRILSSRQLTVLSPSVWTPAGKLRFHDLTAASHSLLTDTYAGGLRRDLSTLLAPGSTTPVGNAPLVVIQPGDSRAYANTPTWGQLRSFLDPERDNNGNLVPRLPREDQSGLSPVMTYASLDLEWFGAEGSTFRIAIFPQVVLWNPYNEPLAPADYEFGFSSGGDQFRLLRKPDPAPSTDNWATWDSVEEADGYQGYRSIHHALHIGDPTALHHHMRFIIHVTEPIPPGESLVFEFPTGHSAQWSRPMTGSAPQHPSDSLVRRGSGPPGYAYLDTGILREPGKEYAVGAKGSTSGGLPVSNSGGIGGIVWAYLGEKDASVNATVQPFIFATAPSLYGAPDYLWPPQNEAGNPRWYQGARAVRRSGSGESIFKGFIQETIPASPLGPGIAGGAWGPSLHYCFEYASNIRHLVSLNPRAPIQEHGGALRSRIFATTLPPVGDLAKPEITSDGRTSANYKYSLLSGNRPLDLILFENPRPEQTLLSIGQLQHANLGYNQRSGAYLIGNSAAPAYGDVAGSPALRKKLFHTENSATVLNYDGIYNRYDWSWLLNRALWDRYFVSTVPQTGDASPVNPRIIRQPDTTDDELRDAEKAAAHLLIKGGFNINSTSEQAWRAVLGAANRLTIPADSEFVGTDAGTDDAPGAAFPRFSHPSATLDRTITPDWVFTGYRRLDEAQIAVLASAIVKEVRNRGPFVSLADFINRRLSDDITTDRAFKGVIQTAIDTAGAAINPTIAPFNSLVSASASNVVGGDAYATYGGATRAAPYSTPQAYAPRFLTQADVLSQIGPALSARSDTFTIRTYGETLNPFTDEIEGRAWCEAVVQRTVTPVTPDPANPLEPTSKDNDLGRRFQIVSFRWLSADDI